MFNRSARQKKLTNGLRRPRVRWKRVGKKGGPEVFRRPGVCLARVSSSQMQWRPSLLSSDTFWAWLTTMFRRFVKINLKKFGKQQSQMRLKNILDGDWNRKLQSCTMYSFTCQTDKMSDLNELSSRNFPLPAPSSFLSKFVRMWRSNAVISYIKAFLWSQFFVLNFGD
jgi:hypothetical protein